MNSAVLLCFSFLNLFDLNDRDLDSADWPRICLSSCPANDTAESYSEFNGNTDSLIRALCSPFAICGIQHEAEKKNVNMQLHIIHITYP